MKTKITIIAASAFWWISGAFAQTPCANDQNGFVNYKNVSTTGSYQLKMGFEEKAAQTYNYSGPGKVAGVRVYGNYPVAGLGGVPLRIGVYNVDGSGKPTTSLGTVNQTWWGFLYNGTGYVDVTFPNGITVNNRFAITVEIRDASPYGDVFNLRYTGNGEGGGQDLASLAGTSTGNNWASAKNSFSKDGDFYLVPTMSNLNVPSFNTGVSCYAVNAPIAFINTSQLSKDSMFNKIGFSNYIGSNKFYVWNFGDGTPVSNLMNPTHSYAIGGVYTTTLTTTIEGWTGTCVKSVTQSISVGLIANAVSVSSINCHGAFSGSFVAGGQYGATPYTYNINNGPWQNSPNFTGLPAGSITLFVKDAKSCISTSNIVINQPNGISFNSILTSNATCGNATGGIITTAAGGIPPLQYKLDNGSFQSAGTFTALLPATHTLFVSDANGCTTSTLVIVNDLGGPTINTPNVTHVSCYGGNDGSITLSSSGGTGLIQYSINGGLSFQTSPVFTSVAGGVYACVVKDNAGCTDLILATVSQGQALSLNVTSSPALCFGSNNGQINVSSTGGTGFHNYSINGINYQSGTSFSGLLPGTYTVYVKDVTSCIKTTTVLVGQPAAMSVTLASTPATCYGIPNGSINATAAGGSGMYGYSINNGNDFQGAGSFLNLMAGTYTVLVKDTYNCTTFGVITITEPPVITTTINTTNSTCTFTNGSIMVIAGGGSGSGYQYSINGGLNFYTSGLFTPLAAGTQYIIVKDGSNCQLVVSGTIMDSNGPVITASSQQNVACNGGSDGSITITTVTGGTGLLQYSKNGVNWQTSPVFTGLQAGTYVIQVMDVNGCKGNVTKTITQPNPFLITTNTSSVACYGLNTGGATITASGGAGFLAYSLNGGAYFQSGTMFNGLPAGIYTVTVKDAANCQSNMIFTIAQPSKINLANLGVLDVTCNGANNGAITFGASGGTAPYLYNLNGSAYSTITTYTGLIGNAYYLVYTKDANNCVVTTSLYINEPLPISVNPLINNITCAGGNNGAISLNVNGGIAPYLYMWSNGSYMPSIFNLSAGVYSVSILDYNGCLAARVYTMSQPSNPLVVNGVVVPASSGTSANGSIDITVNGGVGPYSFSWSNGSNSEDLTGLNPGTYMVIITDANGCVTSSTFNVLNITGLSSIMVNSNDVKVYPNPANDLINIETAGMLIERIDIVNLLGQTLKSEDVHASVSKMTTEELANGTYFIKIVVNNNVITKRVIISK